MSKTFFDKSTRKSSPKFQQFTTKVRRRFRISVSKKELNFRKKFWIRRKRCWMPCWKISVKGSKFSLSYFQNVCKIFFPKYFFFKNTFRDVESSSDNLVDIFRPKVEKICTQHQKLIQIYIFPIFFSKANSRCMEGSFDNTVDVFCQSRKHFCSEYKKFKLFSIVISP